MKRHISRLFVTITFILFFAVGSFAQGPPLPPGHGGDQDQQGNPFQESGPIGPGLIILASLAAIYGAKRVYDARKKLSS